MSPIHRNHAAWRWPAAASAMLLLGSMVVLASLGSVAAQAGGDDAQPGIAARAASTETLSEHSNLHLTYVKGNKIEGRGSASGTVAGSGSVRLMLTSANHAVGEFSGGSARGSISGSISASYRVSGAVSYFTGTVTSVHGTGRYASARSISINFSGQLNRSKLTLTMTATGSWRR
jgi:hypothetical protein